MESNQLLDAFTNMLQTQHAVNIQLTGNKHYVYDPAIVYDRAIAEEIGELYAHLGYKWWKKTFADMGRARMEVIDLLHFELANSLTERIRVLSQTDYGGKFDDYDARVAQATQSLASLFALSASGWVHRETCEAGAAAMNTLDLYRGETCNTQSLEPALTRMSSLFAVAYNVGLTVEQMILWYVGKATLNIFRNEHGYTTGTYIKNWKYDAAAYANMGIPADCAWTEDNDALEWIISQARLTTFAETRGRMYATLETLYGVQQALNVKEVRQ